MEIITEKKALLPIVDAARQRKQIIGFVPTMGALHAGHISLIDLAKKHCDVVVASIFINPTQFNNADDLLRYPRMPESDYALLKSANCDILYAPEITDLYPNGEETEQFDFGHLADTMEGKYRPGHFLGVATIVKRLFEAVKPHKAFFGDKDFQQLRVVQKMVETLALDVQVVGCPVMREVNGLAMSSRNFRLNANQRAAAPAIYEALQYLKLVAGTEKSPQKAKIKAIELINSHPHLAVEYLEIVDQQTLQPIRNWTDADHVRAFVAAFAGEVRLIDNLLLS